MTDPNPTHKALFRRWIAEMDRPEFREELLAMKRERESIRQESFTGKVFGKALTNAKKFLAIANKL